MIMSSKTSKKRYGLLALAILLLLCAGVALYIGRNNFVIRSVGLVLILASVFLVKISNVHSRTELTAANGKDANTEATNHPGPLMWTVGVALLVAFGISYLYLYKDALDGYHAVLPVYVFAGVGLVCGLFWSYLITKLIWRV